MKCLSCGNLIPDASTVCPYCNSKVDPVVSVAPVYADNSLTSAPTTPVTPDLPVAQPGMVAPVQAEAPVAPVEAPVAPVAPVTPEVAPVVPETPVQPVLPQDQGMVVGSPAPAVQPVVATETPVAPTPTPVVESASVAEPIVPAPAPTTAMVNQGVTPPPFGGEKIASTIDAPKKKMSKGALIGIIVAVVVVLVGIGVGVFYYMSQYKSADKRLDTIINTVFKDLVSIKNEEIELGSGSYELSASISSNDTTVSTKLNGMYAIDINNKIADYTLNIESLQFGQELLDAGELNFELYAEGDRIYFLLQNFYDKYIYVDTEGVFVQEENDKEEEIEIDYQKLVIALRDAVKASFRAANKTQTVGEVKIDGKSTKANIIEINFNEANGKIMGKALQNSLANNKVFITEIAKISGKTEEEVKEAILGTDEEEEEDELSDLDNLSKTTTVLKIYTAMFGEEFLGADLTVNTVYDKNHEYYDAEFYEDTKFVVNLFNRGQSFVTVVTSNDEKLFELSIEEEYEKNSTEEINTRKINLSISDKENGATTFKIEGKTISHLQPKVDKVVVKNVISADQMTDADLQGILDKIESYGTLGVLLQSMFGDLTTDLLNPYDTMKENIMCSSATNCVDNGDGTSTCQVCADENCTTTNAITCATLEEDYDFDSEF